MPELLGIPLTLVAACAVLIYLGAIVQTTTGIGVGIVASPLLVSADPSFVPVTIVLAVIPLSLAVAIGDRHHIERGDIGAALVGRVPGVIAGSLIVAAVSARTLSLLVAVTVLGGVAISLIGRRFVATPRSLLVAGFASGFTGTAVGVGGPPMAITYQHADPVVMRATLSAFFFVGSTMSAIALAATGQIGRHELALLGIVFPAALAGWVTGRRYRHRLTGPHVRPAVLALSTLSALALLARTLG